MATVVFADVSGSTGMFQRLGDHTASRLVTDLVASLRQMFQAHGGRVVKLLGDGLFAVFPSEVDALAACVAIQRHLVAEPVRSDEGDGTVQLQMGIASGEVVEIDGDVFGDTVNSAARLADLAGAGQILTTHAVWESLPPMLQALLRSLGPLHLRGRNEASHVYRVQWQSGRDDDVTTLGRSLGADMADKVLVLRSGEQVLQMQGYSPRLTIGRGTGAVLVLNDPRVSRLHATVECRGSQFVLADASSYGTWVYFGEQGEAVVLRRTECFLAGSGQISAGCERRAGSPIVDFAITNG